jgi:hypothetical protein
MRFRCSNSPLFEANSGSEAGFLLPDDFEETEKKFRDLEAFQKSQKKFGGPLECFKKRGEKNSGVAGVCESGRL